MLIVELIYKKPLEQVEAYLAEHRDFLNTYYDDGTFLASGPKEPRKGGVILALCDQDKMAEIIKQDPFCINDIADYKLTEFHVVKCCEALESILKKN
jgi:uncharacterized protein YciI